MLYNHAAKLPLSDKDSMEVADAGNAGPLGSLSLALGELDPGALNVHRQVATAAEPVSQDIFTNVVKGH